MTSGKPVAKSQASNCATDKLNARPRTGSKEAYRQSVKLLHEKCKALQRSNERLVFRLHQVQKMTKKREKDVEILKARLDSHGDGWRTAPDPVEVKEEGEE